jgi:hypothetical protein
LLGAPSISKKKHTRIEKAMTADHTFSAKIDQFKEEASRLQDASGQELIEQTATRLKGLNYAPPVIIPVADLLRLNSNTLLREIDKILALPDQEACALAPDNPKKCQDLRLQFISVLIYYYKQLIRLRQGDPDAWDGLTRCMCTINAV